MLFSRIRSGIGPIQVSSLTSGEVKSLVEEYFVLQKYDFYIVITSFALWFGVGNMVAVVNPTIATLKILAIFALVNFGFIVLLRRYILFRLERLLNTTPNNLFNFGSRRQFTQTKPKRLYESVWAHITRAFSTRWEDFKEDIKVRAADEPVKLALQILFFTTLITVSISFPFYFNDHNDPFEFLEGVLTELHGMVFDLLIIGVFILWFNKLGETRLENKRYHEEIEDFLGWESDEAKHRIIGNIKRLNRNGVTMINLQKAYLYEAKLSPNGGDLRQPENLNMLILWNAQLQGSNLSEANLEGADLKALSLQNTVFEKANLKRAEMRDCNLEGAYLNEALLMNASLISANLRNVNLEGADLRGANLICASLDSSNLDKADLTDVHAPGLDDVLAKMEEGKEDIDPSLQSFCLFWFQGINLVRGQALRTKTSFCSASLREAKLVRGRLRYADFSGAKLNEADLTGSDLEAANLTDADLSGATLINVKLNRAVMKGVNLQNAHLPENDHLLRMFASVSTLYGASLDQRVADLLREHHPNLFNPS